MRGASHSGGHAWRQPHRLKNSATLRALSNVKRKTRISRGHLEESIDCILYNDMKQKDNR
jgi:hypothetical protein